MIRNPNSDESPTPSRLSPAETEREELLTVLAHPVRRRVLSHLDPDDGQTTLSTLADRISEDGESGEHLAVDLHHNHLPKLAECGLVRYDYREHTITATWLPSWVESSLEQVGELAH